ncbi:MAG: ankyrin repeat domain-containing protein [Planctomycetota bacterium]|nr:MAG: ankyrin repeat domain-containing protein [Planctomycetota bacterium]REK39143.1 MAG: ankyrin repeat domain-containing protein [Planctomycetota bacterium]
MTRTLGFAVYVIFMFSLSVDEATATEPPLDEDVYIEGESLEFNAVIAAYKGNARRLERYLAEDIDVNEEFRNHTILRDENDRIPAGVFNYTPLLAVANSPYIDCDEARLKLAEKLLEAGADMEARDSMGRTALVCAIHRNQTALAKFLIEEGADLNTRSSMAAGMVFGLTPTHYAIRNLEILTALIDAGARIDVRDSSGKTPLEVAELFEEEEAAEILREALATERRTCRDTARRDGAR